MEMMNNQTNQLPQRGNRASKAVAAYFFRIFGWQVVGTLPNLPKMVVIGGPHTSNWDLPLLLAISWVFEPLPHGPPLAVSQCWPVQAEGATISILTP